MAEGRRRSGVPTSDWLLNGLVGLVHGIERENVRLAIPVTLQVGGFLVTGYVISGREYFEEFSQMVQAGLPDIFDDEAKEIIASSFQKLADQYDPEGETPAEAVLRTRFGFVHLRDARFMHHSGEPVPSNTGMLWRTKLQSVDGFTLGMLAHQQDDPGLSDEPAIGNEPDLDQ